MVVNYSTFSQFNPRVNTNCSSRYTNGIGQSEAYPNDRLDLESNKISGINKRKWIIGGVLASCVAIATAAILVLRGRMKAVTKLAEHIDFKPAKTIEEAREFAMKNLKIKKYDVGNNLDIANWVNEGITELSNKFKGRSYLPDVVELLPEEYIAKNPGVLATMSHGKMDKKFYLHNTLRINPMLNSVEGMEKFLKNSGILSYGSIPAIPFMKIEDDMMSLLVKVAKNEKLTFKELCKMEAFHRIARTHSVEVKSVLKDLYSQKSFIKLAKSKAPKVYKNFSDLEKLSIEELIKYRQDLFNELLKNGVKLQDMPATKMLNNMKVSPFQTIFHELGHTAHEKNALLLFADMNREGLTLDLFKSQGGQATAAKVSQYAKTAPREFVAEVFAGLVSGNKYSDDVMKLYDQLCGPKIPV